MVGYLENSVLLIDLALNHIFRNYNSNGETPRPYHNTEHTQSTIDASLLIASAVNVSDHERALLTIAAGFHDYIHLGDSNLNNERLSADEAGKKMKEYPVFTDEDIAHVKQMILATRCTEKYPKIVQSPQGDDTCSKILCDADLSSFGKPYDEFSKSSYNYFEELYPGSNKNSDQYTKYLEAEIVILKNHDFWTSEASDIFPHKQQNIQKLIELIK